MLRLTEPARVEIETSQLMDQQAMSIVLRVNLLKGGKGIRDVSLRFLDPIKRRG